MARLYQDQKVPARMKLFGEGKDWFQISKKNHDEYQGRILPKSVMTTTC